MQVWNLFALGWAPFKQVPDVVGNVANAQPQAGVFSLYDDSRVGRIRVGLTDDAMTSFDRARAQLEATDGGRLQVFCGLPAGSHSSPWWEGPGRITLRRLAGQFFLAPQDAADVPAPAAGVPPAASMPPPCSADRVVILPQDETSFVRLPDITRKGLPPRYRGTMEAQPGSQPDTLTLVNELSLEDYLRAVVPNELPASYGLQAIRAQAVAARNYASRPRERAWRAFDVCDSQWCQAYYGAQTETPATNRALADTHGLYALYQGEPILALYSSNNAGYREAYAHVFSDPQTGAFPAPPIPYLSASPDDPTLGPLTDERAARAFWTQPQAPGVERGAQNYRWQFLWRQDDLARSLNRTLAALSAAPEFRAFVTPAFAKGQRLGRLVHVQVRQRGASGKAMVVEIKATAGTWLLRKEHVIRKALARPDSGKALPSANFVVTPISASGLIKIEGGGFGHGVGMSQVGASRLDLLHGWDYPQILQYYYPGIALGTWPLLSTNTAGQRAFFAAPATGWLRVRPHRETPPPSPSDTEPSSWKPALLPADAAQTRLSVLLNDQPVSVVVDARGEANLPVALQPGRINRLRWEVASVPETAPLRLWLEVAPPLVAPLRPPLASVHHPAP
jgi:SpoIID/LytB domain protein